MKKDVGMVKGCTLCPRSCMVDRGQGDSGFCRGRIELEQGKPLIQVARAALHFWEEPCISGEEGSGTVFFSGCSLGCVYCQNREIACGEAGKLISLARLSEIFLELQEQKANNINLVTAGHYAPYVRQALLDAKKQGLSIPVVYNTSSYERVCVLETLADVVDIYLPDFKYLSEEAAARYSHAPDYPQVAKEALAQMVRQSGPPVFDERGMMRRGTIVRHLALPGQMADSKRIIRYLYETYGDTIYISIMNQYTPMPHIGAYPELNRTVTPEEYDALVDYAIELGVENGFIQEGETAGESFIPPFDCTGVEKREEG